MNSLVGHRFAVRLSQCLWFALTPCLTVAAVAVLFNHAKLLSPGLKAISDSKKWLGFVEDLCFNFSKIPGNDSIWKTLSLTALALSLSVATGYLASKSGDVAFALNDTRVQQTVSHVLNPNTQT